MFKFNLAQRFFWSVIGGLAMVLSFPFTGSLAPLMMIAFVPLLLIEDQITVRGINSRNLFVHSYITFFLFNLGTTWWIWNASPGGAILAFVLNGLIMAVVFQLFHITKKNLGSKIGYTAFILIWVGFEYIHYYWELSWPWLNLGNTFARMPFLVQWYAVTGVLGGTLWILLSNVLFLRLFKSIVAKKILKTEGKQLLTIALWLFIPAGISLIQYGAYKDVGIDTEVVVTQPNIDPYNEKFTGSVTDQLNKICDLADQKATEKTDFVLAPETALPFSFYEDEVRRIIYYPYLVERKAKWEKSSLLIGASTQKYFKNKRSRASIKVQGGPGYEEFYNSSMLIDHLDRPLFIHKSKLVLGVEKIPYSNVFPFLETLAINNGGTSGTLGIEAEPQVFKSNGITFAPVVCYESIYGGFIAEQCKKGAELIFIITNDGWWGDTPGYKQHMAFARLRAVENRKCVTRSANTGTSCFINQRGDVLQSTGWWETASLKATLKRNNENTFYIRFGDLIGAFSAIVGGILLIWAIFNRFRYGRKSLKSLEGKT